MHQRLINEKLKYDGIYIYNGQIKKQKTMEEYQQKIDRLDNRWNKVKNWVYLCVLGVIITSICGIYTFIFLVGIAAYTYMFIKQLLEYTSQELISDKQASILLILGIIALIALTDLVPLTNLF